MIGSIYYSPILNEIRIVSPIYSADFSFDSLNSLLDFSRNDLILRLQMSGYELIGYL